MRAQAGIPGSRWKTIRDTTGAVIGAVLGSPRVRSARS